MKTALSIKEIKAKAPDSELYSLDPAVPYILVVDRKLVAVSQVIGLLHNLKKTGVRVCVLAVDDVANSVRLLEVRDDVS